VSATLALRSPWYCAALRRASAWLWRLAQRLDRRSRLGTVQAPTAARPQLDALRACEIAEELSRFGLRDAGRSNQSRADDGTIVPEPRGQSRKKLVG